MTDKQIIDLSNSLRKRGIKALSISKDAILQEAISNQQLKDSLKYFVETTWPKILHPGLLSLYCETVGGDPEEATQTGAALVLLVAAADIHDDIIDQSVTKNSKLTIYGKFGKDIAVLAGDAMLIEGMWLMQRATESFAKKEKDALYRYVRQAFFDLSSAEADEAINRGKIDFNGKVYLELLKRKTAVAEATAKIGAILGRGNPAQVESLGQYGRTLGLLLTLRDEFIDVYEPSELTNRYTNEVLPVPILFAMMDNKVKAEILPMLRRSNLSEEDTDAIVDTVMSSVNVEELKAYMRELVEYGTKCISAMPSGTQELGFLLKALLEDLT